MRNLMWTRQKINFVQGLKDFDDQPSFYEYIQWQKAHKQFGAVLGYPIHHSRTPVTQGLNMQDYGPILAIPLEESDFELAFIFLQQLGLKFAAVTSPLKLKAAALVDHKTSEEGINSIFFDGQKWLGISSDANGFATAIEESGIEDISSLSIAIWGGGGVIASIKQIFPAATQFSSRTGKRRDNANDSEFKPDMVIWAAPRHNDVVMPPNDWKPRYIVDLNYIENSLGLEYAQSQAGATYMSGLDMFYAQAKKQFKFWATQFINEAHEKKGRI
jgi:shikimate 5-dehydrogenase